MRMLVYGSLLLCIACVQYATGMGHVFINGVAVFEDGEHTGALPGRFVRGPGYKQAQ